MADLKLQIILNAIDKATAPFKAVQSSAGALSRSLLGTKKELRELGNQQKMINEFGRIQNTLQSNGTALTQAKSKMAQLGREIEKVGVPTKEMTRSYVAASAEVAQLSDKNASLTSRLKDTQNALSKAKIDTTDLAQAQVQLKTQMGSAEASITKQEASLKRLSHAQDGYNRASATAGKLAGAGAKSMMAGAAAGAPVLKSVTDFMALEDAMVGVARQVPGLKDESGKFTAEYDKWLQKIKEMSTVLPLPTAQIADLVTAGARMDIAKDELEGFVQTAVKMATAFDGANPAEMAENFGKVQKNYKLTAVEAKELADVINYLDDNAISKGDGIIDYMSRVSGMAAATNMTSKQVAALGSTLMTMGAAPEEAATSVNALLTRLAAPNKEVVKGLTKIGLTSEAVQKGMVTDAQGTIFKIMAALKKLPEEQRIGVLKNLAGQNHIGKLANLAANQDEWERQIKLSLDPDALGSMDREFDTRMTALSSQWELFKNKMFNSSSAMGAGLKTTLVDLANMAGKVLDKFAQWQQDNPKTVATLMRVAAGISVFLIAAGAALVALSPLIIGMATFRLGLAQLSSGVGAIAKIGQAFMWLGRIFLLNPVGLAITVIVTALYLLWSRWDAVKSALAAGWRWLDQLFDDNPILNALFPVMGVIRYVSKHWGLIASTAATAWGGVKSVVMGALTAIGSFLMNWTPIGFIVKNWENIKLITAAVWEIIKGYVKSAAEGIAGFFMNWTLPGLIVQHWSSITGAASAAWAWITGAATGAGNAITGFFANWPIFTAVTGHFSHILSFMGSLVGQFTTAGGQMIQGLINGVMSGVGALRNAISSAAQSAIDEMKAKLGIKSPSRVFAGLGRFTSQGLAVGISDGAGRAVSAVADMGQTLINKASGLALPLPTLGGAASALVDKGRGLMDTVSNVSLPKFAAPALAGAAMMGGQAVAAPATPAPSTGATYQITINASSTAAPDIEKAVMQAINQLEASRASRARSSFVDKD